MEGEVIFVDAPLVVYLEHDAFHKYCTGCLRKLQHGDSSPAHATADSGSDIPEGVKPEHPCTRCSWAFFCSRDCMERRRAESHPEKLCQAYCLCQEWLSRNSHRLTASRSDSNATNDLRSAQPEEAAADPRSAPSAAPLTSEELTSLRFLLAAYLHRLSPQPLPPSLASLLSLQASHTSGASSTISQPQQPVKAGRLNQEEASSGARREAVALSGPRNTFDLLLGWLDGGSGDGAGRDAGSADGSGEGLLGASARLHGAVLASTDGWWRQGRKRKGEVAEEQAEPQQGFQENGSSAGASREGGGVGWHGAPELRETEALLCREQRNAFGLMAPWREGGARSLQGGAIYPLASLLNHSCYPSVCRFDNLDGGTAEATFHAMRCIEAGEELLISYFSIDWPLPVRQQRLQEEYGFTCKCKRCELETKWAADEGSESQAGEEDQDAQEADPASPHSNNHEGSQGEDAEGSVSEEELAHALFILKHMCEVEGCGGTRVALPGEWTTELDSTPKYVGSSTLVCNVCNIHVDKKVIESKLFP